MPRLLIVTADDYGFTAGINRGIDACVEAGSIRSVCVMTNMPFWKEIEILAARHPDLSVGIHWNVTQGRPLLPPGDVSSLLGPDGEFLPPRRFRQEFRRGTVSLRQLEAELEAQIRRMRDSIPTVAYWNTHQNIHVTRGLYAPFTEIARRLGIRVMRSHRRRIARGGRPALGYFVRHPVFWLKGIVLGIWASNAARRGMALPVVRIIDPEYPAGCVALVDALRGTDWEGAAELVTHPAANLDGLYGLTTMLDSRVAEFRVFSDPHFAARLAAQGIELSSFAAIEAHGGGEHSETPGRASVGLSGRSTDRI